MIRGFTWGLLFFTGLILVIKGTLSCSHEAEDLDRFPEICFERDILPVFQNGCAISGCHDEFSARKGIRLADYSSIMAGQELAVPGNPSESKIFKVITEDPDDEDYMPPKPYNPLTQAQIDSIFNWIKGGARQEDCPALCDTVRPVVFEGHILPVINRYCRGCHSGTDPRAGLALIDYPSVKQAVESRSLLGAIRRTGASPMPPSISLDDCTVELFENWKTDGYIEKKGGLQ